MRLRSLSLEQFRSYERLIVQLPEANRQIFIGENGEGKTNLVEAVSFLSMGRSCLRAQCEDIVRWGTDFFRIRAETIADDGTEATIEYVWQLSPRRQSAMFVRDIKVPLLQFIGTLPTIVFLPQDLDLFTGAPSARRSFLDSLLSQLKPAFAASRLEYEQILKQRNALVSRIADGESPESDLDLWDERLAHAAAELTLARQEVIDLFNERLAATISSLGEGEWSDIRMMHIRKTTALDEATIEAELLQLFQNARLRDLAVRATTVGPHREDWQLCTAGRNIAVFASRGQQRAALISLLLGSATLFEQVRGEHPVILLDDVLSELDDHHQSALLDSLSGHQVFITATHTVPIEEDVVKWKVNQGAVTHNS